MKRRIFATLLTLCICLALLPTMVFADAPNTYHTGDIAVINSIIDAHPELGWAKAPANGSSKPNDWNNKVYWNYGVSPRRVTELYLENFSLTGTLDVSGLTALTHLYCNNNQLTGLNVSGLTALTRLDCGKNQLTGTLDVSGLTALTHLYCNNNQLTGLKLNSTVTYQKISAYRNYMANSSAVTDAPFNWDDKNYRFDPQHKIYTITNILTDITTDNPATHRLTSDHKDYEATLTADPGYLLPEEIDVRVDGVSLTRNKDYTYDSTNGTLKIFAASINGDDPQAVAFKPNSAASGGSMPGISGEIEIEAVGVRIPIYSVSVQTEGSGTVSSTPKSGTKGTIITLKVTPASGWQFKEWQIVSGTLGISGNKFMMPDSNVVVKAIFEAISAKIYSISVTGGEARVKGAKVNKAEAGVKVDLIANVPEGKVFDQWVILTGAPELVLKDSKAASTSFTMPNKSVVLQATFKDKSDAEEGTVIFDPAGGKWEDGTTTSKKITATVGNKITIVEAPVKKGYKFQYWNRKDSKYQPGNKYQVPSGKHTLTAVWAKTTKSTDQDQTLPKTGENTGTHLWQSLLLFVASGLLLVLRKKILKQRD